MSKFALKKFQEPEVRVIIREIAQEMSNPRMAQRKERILSLLGDKGMRRGLIAQNAFENARSAIQATQSAESLRLRGQREALNRAEEAARARIFSSMRSVPQGIQQARGTLTELVREQELREKQLLHVQRMQGKTQQAIASRRNEILNPWSDQTVETLILVAKSEIAKPERVLAFAGMLDAWQDYFAHMLDSTKNAFENMDLVLKEYITDVSQRRERYVKIFTTLVGAGLGVVGLGGIADALGNVIVSALNNFTSNEILNNLARKAVGEGVQAVNNANIADPVAKELANKVEGVLHNPNLGKMREQVQKLGTALDTRQWLFDLAASIDTDLQTLRSEVGRSIGNVRPSADHAQALLNVMTRRTGLHNLLHNSQMSSDAVESKRKQVYENCKAFYEDWAAVILNEIFERYERPQMIDVSVLTKLDVTMEKWAWAIFVRNSTDSQLKDMANATKGLLGSEESVFMKRMTALGIVVRRQDRSTQDEAMKATTLAGAAAGRQFAVGYSTVGDTSIRALRGWSDFMLGKSPIDHALGR